MAVLFSAVTATADDQITEFLVSGIPQEYEDLEGWSILENFLDEIERPTEVSIHAEAYLYGEGETVRATPEEVAYMMMRMERTPDFLTSRCDNIDASDFSFLWDPGESFEMEMI